jgi:hypothetical protein
MSSDRAFRNLSAKEKYRAVQWGCESEGIVKVEVVPMTVRQELLLLGLLRKLWFEDGSTLVPSQPYPVLAYGEKDNHIYFVGGSVGEMAKSGKWGKVGSSRVVVQIDYLSKKGKCHLDGTRKKGRGTYYYHEHRAPFPRLRIDEQGWPEYVGGGYRVRPEGIVG